MPALANFVLSDGQATPVSQTFNIESAGQAGKFGWVNRGSGYPLRYERIAYNNYRGKNSQALRHQYQVMSPVTDANTVGGIDRLIAQGMVDIKLWVPDMMSDARRADMIAFAVNLLNNTNVKTNVRYGESWY